jgi:hypothetical protein
MVYTSYFAISKHESQCYSLPKQSSYGTNPSWELSTIYWQYAT